MIKYTNNGRNERNHTQHKNTTLKDDHWAAQQKLDLARQKLTRQTSTCVYWPPYEDATSNQYLTTTNKKGGLRGSLRGNIDTEYGGSKGRNVTDSRGGYYNEHYSQEYK
jgi:hypothetical protein